MENVTFWNCRSFRANIRARKLTQLDERWNVDKRCAGGEESCERGREGVCEKYKLGEPREEEKEKSCIDTRFVYFIILTPDNLELSFESNKLIRYT